MIAMKAAAPHAASEWTPPDGLDRARPREVRLTTKGKLSVLAALLCLLGGLALAVSMEVKARQWVAGMSRRRAPPIGVRYAVAGATVLAAAVTVLQLQRERSLLSNGRAAPGIVTRHRRGQHGTVVYFEFTLYGGRKVKGRGGPMHHPPAVGSALCVLYDPDDPRRATSYPTSQVALVRTRRL
jgi:hypothetical protein